MRPKVEHCADTRIEVFRTMAQVLEIDVSHEPGVYNFLHLHRSIKDVSPATTLEKVATCTTAKGPFSAQELKVFSNLLFIVNYCRAATICGHYSENDRPLPPADNSYGAIVREMKLNLPSQKRSEWTQAIKHAESVMQTFKALYDIDKEALAQSWLLLYGGLAATVLFKINALQEKATVRDAYKKKIHQIHGLFSDLKDINPTLPLLDKAVALLSSRDPKKLQSTSAVNAKAKPRLTRRGSDSPSEESIGFSTAPAHKKPLAKPKPHLKRKRIIDQVADAGTSSKTKVRKTVEHDVSDWSSASSSIDEHDAVRESRQTFEYGNTLQVENIPYNAGFMPNFAEHSSFTSSATNSFVANIPQSATLCEPPPRDWEVPENETVRPWPYGHPPLVLPDTSPSFLPYALDYNGYDWSQYRHPIKWGSDGYVLPQQDILPLDASMPPLPSPAPMQPLTPAGQRPTMTSSAGSNFYHMTAKHFDGSNAQDATRRQARPHDDHLFRRPSEPIISTREFNNPPRLWHDDQEHGMAPVHDAEYASAMLPPQPESSWLQTEHYDPSSHGTYYHTTDQQFHGHRESPYLATAPGPIGHDDIHQTPKQHHHQHHHPHFQNSLPR